MTRGLDCRVESSLAADEALATIDAAKTPWRGSFGLRLGWNPRSVVVGSVESGVVTLMGIRSPAARNSWRPQFVGRVQPTASGSELRGRVRVLTGVRIFVAAWFGFLALLLAICLVASLASLATAHWQSAAHAAAFAAGMAAIGGFGFALNVFALRKGLRDAAYLQTWLSELLHAQMDPAGPAT